MWAGEGGREAGEARESEEGSPAVDNTLKWVVDLDLQSLEGATAVSRRNEYFPVRKQN